MNENQRYILLLVCFIVFTANACKRAQQENNNPENTISIKGSVRDMELYPDPQPPFPEHEGKAEFVAYCAICHSLKYISSQPDFAPKVWTAEVHKMVEKYHAPIDTVTAKKIVDYLVAVKSKH